jgi:hypothetical protein
LLRAFEHSRRVAEFDSVYLNAMEFRYAGFKGVHKLAATYCDPPGGDGTVTRALEVSRRLPITALAGSCSKSAVKTWCIHSDGIPNTCHSGYTAEKS